MADLHLRQHLSLILQVHNISFDNGTENILYVVVKEYTFLNLYINDGNKQLR